MHYAVGVLESYGDGGVLACEPVPRVGHHERARACLMPDEEPFPERPWIDGEGRVLERSVEQLD